MIKPAPPLDPIPAVIAEHGAKKLLTTSEAARSMACGQDCVRALIQSGKLEAFADNAHGKTSRLSYRVTSRSVLWHLVSKAQYNADLITDALCAIIRTITSRAVLERIIAAATHQLAKAAVQGATNKPK